MTRKRKHNFNNWKREKAKRSLNAGWQYVSYKTNKNVERVSLGPPCFCSSKCYGKLMGDEENIFHSFWDIGDFNAQNNSIMDFIEIIQKKRR